MTLKYLSNDNHLSPANQFGAARVFNPNSDNNPPRVLLRDCPIVARHWFGMDQEAV